MMEKVIQEEQFERYEAYKDSGVDWIGEVPESWEIRRGKFLFSEINERSFEGTGDLLSVSQYTGVTKRSDKLSEGDLLTNASSLEGYKKVAAGDLVSNIMLAWNGSIGFSSYEGITSPAYSIYRLKGADDQNFFHYLLRSTTYKGEYKRRSKGVIESRLRLYTESFFDIPFLLPPLPEQRAIATFLDRKCAQIDQAIAQKERLIELLKERQQVIIQRAVTKGLDPGVKMKDSGVEWIGEVPEGWGMKKNKTLFTERVEPGREGLPLLSVSIHSGVSNDELDEDDNIRGKIKIADKRNYQFTSDGDIVFNMMRAWQGAIGATSRQGMVSPAYIVAAPKYLMNSKYFEYQFRTSRYIHEMNCVSKGITDFRKRLYWHEFKQLYSIVPPIETQDVIVSFVKEMNEKIGITVESQQKHIKKLREYKSVLIDNAVTGKIKIK